MNSWPPFDAVASTGGLNWSGSRQCPPPLSETALHWRTKSVSACESRLVQLLPPVNRALHECQNAK